MTKTKTGPKAPKGFTFARKTGVLVPIAIGQHCTNKHCTYTLSHTGMFCGFKQNRPCRCVYCYGH